MRALISIFLLLIATSIEARMYQWVNPTTGRSQLSGKAPSWYRSDTGGPRVLVFEKNVMVDDTAVAVDEDQRLQLRGKALPTELAKEQEVLSQKQAIAKLEEQIEALAESPVIEEYLKNSPARAITTTEKNAGKKAEETDLESTEESSDQRVERLKALISAWDHSKTEKAKSLIEPEKTSVAEPSEK